MIVATAGHVDHGKTVLVKALTGIDTDRLPEEKARGLSIDLGFAYLPTDHGAVIGFIDVPGHQRFIRNMVAGVAGIDHVLLVVAADDGPMPQTVEHLAIVELLGAPGGAVVITKIDRVEARRVAEVVAAVDSLVGGTVLDGAPVFAVCPPTGQGMAPLLAHLVEAARRPSPRPRDSRFRLAVDRAFTLPGIGLVTTGTVVSGTVRTGQRLVVTPAGIEVRVRGLHAQNRQSPIGRAGQRCGLDLVGPGLRKQAVRRGDWIVDPALHAPTRRLDVRLRLLPGEVRPLGQGTRVRIHLGPAEVLGRAVLLDGRTLAPGAEGLAQLVLEAPIGALWGDRLVVRDRSARRTMAGGMVIDPDPPGRGRARPRRLDALRAAETRDAEAALAAVVERTPDGLDLEGFARARNLPPGTLPFPATPMVVLASGGRTLALSPSRFESLEAGIVAALGERRGEVGVEPLRRLLESPPPAGLLEAVLDRLRETGVVARRGSLVALPGHNPELAEGDRAPWGRVRPLLEKGGVKPPTVADLARTLELRDSDLAALLKRAGRLGLVVRVSANRFLLPPAVLALAGIAEAAAGEAGGRLGLAAFRHRAGVGRNLAIEILEHFDRTGLTARHGDTRRIARPAGVALADGDP